MWANAAVPRITASIKHLVNKNFLLNKLISLINPRNYSKIDFQVVLTCSTYQTSPYSTVDCLATLIAFTNSSLTIDLWNGKSILWTNIIGKQFFFTKFKVFYFIFNYYFFLATCPTCNQTFGFTLLVYNNGSYTLNASAYENSAGYRSYARVTITVSGASTSMSSATLQRPITPSEGSYFRRLASGVDTISTAGSGNIILSSSVGLNQLVCGRMCATSSSCASYVYKTDDQNCTLYLSSPVNNNPSMLLVVASSSSSFFLRIF